MSEQQNPAQAPAAPAVDDNQLIAERREKLKALRAAQAEGNRTAAARLLGVTFRSMRYRLERLGIE